MGNENIEECEICGREHEEEYGCWGLAEREYSAEANDYVECRECGEFAGKAQETTLI